MRTSMIVGTVAATMLLMSTSNPAQAFRFPPMRFFEPDAGLPVRFYVSGADAEMRAAVEAALAVWNDVPCASIVLELAGDVAPSRSDGLNVISFGDPFDAIDDPVRCGGVLAVDGFVAGPGIRLIDGVTYRQIGEADITVNDGWTACATASLPETLVRSIGRALGADDEAALCKLYPLDAPAQPLPPRQTFAPAPLGIRTMRVGKNGVTVTARFTAAASTTMPQIAAQPVVLTIGPLTVMVSPGEWTSARRTLLMHRTPAGTFILRSRDGVRFTLLAKLRTRDVKPFHAGVDLSLIVNGAVYAGSKR